MSLCPEGLDTASDAYIGYLFKNVAIAFIVLQTFFVGLRFLARHLNSTPMGADDILVPLSLIFNYALCGVSIAMVEVGGVGRHTLWNCVYQPSALAMYAKLQIPFTVVIFWSITFAKVAILSLYLRIFLNRYLRLATYVVVAIQIGSAIANTIVTCNVCTPLAFLWEPDKHPGGRCIDINSFWVWCNFPQIITDVVILVLPLHTLWRLKLSNREKVGVVVTFSTGSIGLVTSIVRFVIFHSINSQTDGNWVAARLGCISIAESGVYLIAACLPVYRSLLRTVKRSDRMGTSRVPYGSKNMDSSELANLSRSARGFSRLDKEAGGFSVTAAPYRSPDSDEMLVHPHDIIKVQREFTVTTDKHV